VKTITKPKQKSSILSVCAQPEKSFPIELISEIKKRRKRWSAYKTKCRKNWTDFVDRKCWEIAEKLQKDGHQNWLELCKTEIEDGDISAELLVEVLQSFSGKDGWMDEDLLVKYAHHVYISGLLLGGMQIGEIEVKKIRDGVSLFRLSQHMKNHDTRTMEKTG
jgi:hypothetical protein